MLQAIKKKLSSNLWRLEKHHNILGPRSQNPCCTTDSYKIFSYKARQRILQTKKFPRHSLGYELQYSIFAAHYYLDTSSRAK
jgi:hypothetical protein